jgi:hypothetical protein
LPFSADLQLLAAAALFGASVAAWLLAAPLRKASRLYLRFAAVLLSALSVTCIAGLGDVAALFLLPLACAALALSALARFARPLRDVAATLALVASLASGLAAMLSGIWILALDAGGAGCSGDRCGQHQQHGACRGGVGRGDVRGGTGPLAGRAKWRVAVPGGGIAGSFAASAFAVHQQRLARHGGAIGGFHRHGFAPFRHHLAQQLCDKRWDQTWSVPKWIEASRLSLRHKLDLQARRAFWGGLGEILGLVAQRAGRAGFFAPARIRGERFDTAASNQIEWSVNAHVRNNARPAPPAHRPQISAFLSPHHHTARQQRPEKPAGDGG